MLQERRRFARVNFHIPATLEWQGAFLEGELVNLSLQGLQLTTQEVMAVDDSVDVSLRIPGTRPPLEFRLRTIVAWVAPGTIGLKICETDIQSFTHLRYIVAMKSDDPDRVLG